MGLTKHRIGEFVKLYSMTCNIPDLTANQISGINREKEFFEPARQVGKDTSNYKIVPSGYFACNLMHVGRDCVLPIALNHTEKEKIVSNAYHVFYIPNDAPVISDYFFILLKSFEKDRYFWFHADASVRDGMTWENFCDMEICLPSVPIQHKYTNIYKAMVANQQSYERGLEDLKKVFDSYIDKLRKQGTTIPIGNYLDVIEEKNEKLLYGEESVRGISIEKKFIYTKANMNGVNLKPYYIVKPNEFAYVSVTSRNGEKISLAINDSNETYICSSSYIAFKSKDANILWPKYLMLFLLQSEFDRYARFNSWGSARETFDWEEMCNVQIPIPDIQTQKAIADIFTVYTTRKRINEQLKAKIKEICPILICGSLANGGLH